MIAIKILDIILNTQFSGAEKHARKIKLRE